MAVMFPLDDDGHPIPVLGFDYRGTQKLAVGRDLGPPRRADPVGHRDRQPDRHRPMPVRGRRRQRDGRPGASPVLFPGQYLDVPLRHGERWIAFIADGEPCDAYVIGRV